MKLKAFFFPDTTAPIPSVRDIQAVQNRKQEADKLRATLINRRHTLSMRMKLEAVK